MEQASNPSGRRVIIVITGITRNVDCEGQVERPRHTQFMSQGVLCVESSLSQLISKWRTACFDGEREWLA
jgi:hypothetical protein